MTDLNVQEAAEELAFRLRLYRMMKEGAWFLRQRLDDQETTWWAYDGYESKVDDDPQGRLL